MFHSIRSKIMAIIVLIVAVSTASTIFFSTSMVQRDTIKAQDASALNIMHLSMLFIDNEHKDLEIYAKALMNRRKQYIKDNMRILEGGLDVLARLAKDGKLSLAEAQKRAKELIRSVRFGDEDYFFAYNMDFVNLAHPDLNIQGRDLSDHKDVKGDHYSPDLLAMIKDKGEGFRTIWWERLGDKEAVPKILYVKHFSPWDWILGTGIYIDDIQKMVDRGRLSMIANLKASLKKVRMAGSGEMFIFEAGEKMVVPPQFMEGKLDQFVNAATGRKVLDELENAAEKGVNRVEIEVSGPGGYKEDLIFHVKFFSPLKWIVASFVPRAELLRSVDRLVLNQVLANTAILLATLLIAVWVVRRICRPFSHLAEVARFIALGDIRGAKAAFGDALGRCGTGEDEEDEEEGREAECVREARDETGVLYGSFKAMADNLNSLVGKVKHAEGMVASQAAAISGTVNELDSAIVRQAKATGEVGVQATEITALAGELAGTMNDVSEVAHDTAVLAEEGLSGLDDIDDSMARLKQATEAISSKLTVINDKAGNIGQVVTTISKVSEKTNLLSLNASIEAEKAGEFGQGFAVVAREIRKLADQTDIATLDITKIVGEMRSAVSAGVMEMDKFGREVELNAAEITRISDRISSIIGHVGSLEPRVLSVNEGMQSQRMSAESITGSIVELGQSAEQTKELLMRFVRAAGGLSESIASLKEEISKFQVDEAAH